MNFVLVVFCVLMRGAQTYNLSCGLDKSKISIVYDGSADIETYPWMGTLIYQLDQYKLTASVILVTKQIALSAAHEIDKLPKHNLRENSRVILGRSCNGTSDIRIRDYTFHPDYEKNTYSALAMLQLEVDLIPKELLIPVCPPPTYFINPNFYAMTPSYSCKKGKIMIRKMHYVSKEECKEFYRRAGLDILKIWPTHTACARAHSGGKCTWRSGTALVVKQDGRWKLLGFGLYGPGCQSPARFLDYGMEEQWVRNSIARIGQPAITRLAPNHLIMRRSSSNVQRFGPCDLEETRYEAYTDRITIKSTSLGAVAKYNVTLIHGVEYSCVVFKGNNIANSGESDELEQPEIYLRRWCAGPPNLCFDFHLLEIHFYVDIIFMYNAEFSVAAYGKAAKILDPIKAMLYVSKEKRRPPIPTYGYLLSQLRMEAKLDPKRIDHRFFHKSLLQEDGIPSEAELKLLKERPVGQMGQLESG